MEQTFFHVLSNHIIRKLRGFFNRKRETPKKVATAIKQGFEEAGFQVKINEQFEAEKIDFFAYDLVRAGAPNTRGNRWNPWTSS